MDKPRLIYPVIVEGKYDKSTLLSVFDATVVTLGGFAVFNSREKQALLRRLARDGIIILTDPDGGGKQLRSFLQGILPKDKVHNAYVPKLEGKEKRKDKPSKAGLLGVEGVGREVLERALAPFVDEGRVEKTEKKTQELLTKVDFFVDKLTGCDNAAARRAALARAFDLPDDMTANALLDALNIVTDREGYRAALESIESVGDATD